MNKRGFLKLLSAVGASIALPVPKFVLAEPLIVVPEMPVVLGGIRAMGAYHKGTDLMIVRLDACNGKEMFGVDFKFGANPQNIRHNYLQARTQAEEVLRNAIIKEGWLASSLIILPTPDGYVEPEWMHT